MSVKALSAVFEESRAKDSAFVVLLAMADWADQNGRCYPSYGQIAHKARVSRATAIDAIRSLVTLGELERIGDGQAPLQEDDEAPAKVRSQWRNLYRIVLVKARAEVVQPLDYLSDAQVVQSVDQQMRVDVSQVVQPAGAGGPTEPSQVVQPTDLHIRKNRQVDRQVDRQQERAAAVSKKTADLESFRGAWNEAITGPLKPAHTLTPKRRRSIRACLVRYSLDDWRGIFARINLSSFCRGENRTGFVASFDWLIGSIDPAVKCLEGQYDDHISEAELQAARAQQARVGGCPHDPRCVEWRVCVRELALHLRARRAS